MIAKTTFSIRTLAAVCLIAIFAVTGCSSNGNVDLSADEAAQKILESVTFRDSLVKVEGVVLENIYMLGESDSDEYAVYVSGSGATTEEIAVLRIEGGKGEDARAVLESRIEEQKFRYEFYLPAQMAKLEDPVILSKGDMIIMILSDDRTEAENAIKSIFG